ncbi:MAG: hypothetical protein H0T69_16260 [Thermoleophilaceae bacterium]|nr:hypothetical protein [Thermoleophilaceae bacterium]
MDRRVARPEDLPPLELRRLRELDLDAPSGPGRAAHISAASGVVQRADFVYVVGDDELFLGVFEVSTDVPGRLERVLSGDLPTDRDGRKGAKPDLEALTVLPPFEEHPHGALLGLGSGSTPARDRGFVWGLAADGSLEGQAREIDLAPLYSLLRGQVKELNIEGAAVMGDQLWLLQRGNSELGANVVAELALSDVMGSLLRDRTFAAAELQRVRAYDLGELDGVKLTFSDASPLGGELLVFTASAESSGDTYEDGAILGSVVGTIDRDGEVRRLRTIDRAYKVEGVHATLDTGVMTLTFVCDQDDPDVASPLLSATMPLADGVEHGAAPPGRGAPAPRERAG